MERLTVDQIIERIQNEHPFEAVSLDYSFTIKIEAYVHYICGAVHDGHQFRRSLWDNCLHSEYDRWFEEDPATKQMVQSHPIVIAGCDSRFEYDLNREPESAIYEDAWGKKLWREPLTDNEKQQSLSKHNNFYKVVNALITKLESLHKAVVVYDMHSYNWRRWDREVPVINLGTKNIDNKRFGAFVDNWSESLSQLQLPHSIAATSKINDTFQGNGYFLKYITQHFNNTLVLATEFKKIYCDELNQIMFPEVVAAIEAQLLHKLPAHARQFYQEFCQ
jgi:N-formylglutamate amidohydrolase